LHVGGLVVFGGGTFDFEVFYRFECFWMILYLFLAILGCFRLFLANFSYF